MNQVNENKDVTMLAYDLTYHRYLLNKGKAQNLFHELTIQEYIALHIITKGKHKDNFTPEKVYLRELAERMEVSIHQASNMARELKDRGLVRWSHDGDGSEGTYITITESGISSMLRQEAILDDYYGRVIERFGRDNLIALMSQIDELEKIMDNEFNEKGDGYGAEDIAE